MYPGYSPYTVYDLGGSGSGYSSRAAPTYEQLGRNWGQDLRQEIVSWDQFVAHMESLSGASPEARDEFRRGFASTYGSNADAAFNKALEAAQVTAPPP